MASIRALVLILCTLVGSSPFSSIAGDALVEAYLLLPNGGYGYRPFFTLVSWDGKFLDARPGTQNEVINVIFKSRWGDDESVPNHSTMDGPLNQQTATAMVNRMLNSWPWSPWWRSPPPRPTPSYFTITFKGSGDAYFSLFVKVNKWENVDPPVACTIQSENIIIGPVLNSAITSGSAPVTVNCNAATNYRLTIGTAGGNAIVPYTAGGQVRMSFSGGTAQQPNVYLGRSEKNETTQTTASATTVPGTALPGTYSASAVLKVDIL